MSKKRYTIEDGLGNYFIYDNTMMKGCAICTKKENAEMITDALNEQEINNQQKESDDRRAN